MGKNKTSQVPSSTLSISRCEQGVLVIGTKLNSVKIKWIQKLLNPTNAPWEISCRMYQLNLILNSNQRLSFFREKQIHRSNRQKNFQKQNNEDFFIQLLNA